MPNIPALLASGSSPSEQTHTPMMQGFQAAMDVGATEIAVFTAASEQVC